MTKNDQIAQMIGNDRPHKDAECAQAALDGDYVDPTYSVRPAPPPPNPPRPFGAMRKGR